MVNVVESLHQGLDECIKHHYYQLGQSQCRQQTSSENNRSTHASYKWLSFLYQEYLIICKDERKMRNIMGGLFFCGPHTQVQYFRVVSKRRVIDKDYH